MADMMISDEKREEASDLAEKARLINAYISDTKLNIHTFTDEEDAVEALKDDIGTDMAVTEVAENGSTLVAEKVRAQDDDASIMLVADASVSPAKYLTPKVRACSLLLRPYSDEVCADTMRDFMTDYYTRLEESDEKIIVESFGEKIAVPVSQIYYVEARGRKNVICLRNSEYSEYGTFDKVLEELGDRFIRCHRSFAFNRSFFQSVKLSENMSHLSK